MASVCKNVLGMVKEKVVVSPDRDPTAHDGRRVGLAAQHFPLVPCRVGAVSRKASSIGSGARHLGT